MRKGCQIGSFWYFIALYSPKGLFNFFGQHVHPIFASGHQLSSDPSPIVANYWPVDIEEVIAAKLQGGI